MFTPWRENSSDFDFCRNRETLYLLSCEPLRQDSERVG